MYKLIFKNIPGFDLKGFFNIFIKIYKVQCVILGFFGITLYGSMMCVL